MNTIQEILPYLQDLVEKRDCAINVLTQNNEVVVNIIDKMQPRSFKSADSGKLITNLKHYMQA